jgi:hypothetical protein
MQPRLLVAVFLAWTASALAAYAQEQEVRTIPFDGPEIVCHILHSLEMTPILTLEAAATNAEQTVIIVLGNPQIVFELHRATGGLKQFLTNGGNLLIATDYRLTDHDLSIHISGKPIRTPNQLRDHFAYGGEVQCPKLGYTEPDWFKLDRNDPLGGFLQERRDVRDHPLFSFLKKEIATNCPSNVDVLDGDESLQDLLVFPFGRLRLRGGGLRGGPERYMVGSQKDAPPRGRALYIAGDGLFLNGMMLQSDNDNFDFTVNAFRWLREGPQSTKRTNALLVVNGEIITNFNMNLTPPAQIPIPPLKMLNRLIRGLENERFFHRVLSGLLGSNIGRVVAVLAGLVTFVVLLYGAKKIIAGRHHVETAAPSLIAPQPVISATDPMEQRQQALLRQGDFWDESRQLVREWFRREFDVAPNRWLAGVDAKFHVEGSFWSRWRLQRQADYVLRLARAPGLMRVSRPQFFALVEGLKQLTGALKDGRVALLVEGKNVRQT